MKQVKDQQFAVQILESCQESVPVGLQNDAVMQQVPELKKLKMNAPYIVSAARDLGSATAALCAQPTPEVVELLKLEQRAKLKVMLDANLAAGIGALVTTATPPLVDELLLCASSVPAFSQLLACGSQPLTMLLQSLAYPEPLTLWCGALLSDTARLLSHHDWMAVFPGDQCSGVELDQTRRDRQCSRCPTDGADFAMIVDALNTSGDLAAIRTIERAVADLNASPGSTLVSYRVSTAKSAAKQACHRAEPHGMGGQATLDPKALPLMITETLAQITYQGYFQTVAEKAKGGGTYEFLVETRTSTQDPWENNWAAHFHQDRGASTKYPAAGHFKRWSERERGGNVERWPVGSDTAESFFEYYPSRP